MKNRVIKFRAWDELPKYEIGDDGSVWSLDYNHTGQRKRLNTYPDKDGYPYVYLVVKGKRYKRYPHRMVAISFIPNPDNKPQVNHKDRNRNNPDVSNLEWATAQENYKHSWDNGRQVTEISRAASRERFLGLKNPKVKINKSIASAIRA